MSISPPELKSEIVRAGAGAGKTTTLVSRVIGIVQHYKRHHQRWPKLVVTTFTRKATQELRERLTVEALTTNADGLDPLELLDYCRSKTRLHISTIHGVLSQFLRRYGHLLGMDPSFGLLTDTGARQLRRQILRQILKENHFLARLLEQYSFAQIETIARMYANVVAPLSQSGPLSVDLILKSQAEAAQRMARKLAEIANELDAATSHPKFVEFNQHVRGMVQALSQPWNKDNLSALERAYEAMPNKPSNKNVISEDLSERISLTRKELKSWLENPAFDPAVAQVVADNNSLLNDLCLQFSNQFQTEKIKLGRIEMSDLENLTLQKLRENPAIAEAFASDYDYWLIDEFQDTSPIQVELFAYLAGRRPRFIVGDPQQSIYLFRGARVEVFKQQQQQFLDAGIATQELLKNYRSTPALLTFLNDFFDKLGRGFQAMQPREEISSDRPIVAWFENHKRADDGNDSAELLGIFNHVQRLLSRPGTSASDICILARTNQSLMTVAQFLKDRGVATHVHAARGYFQRREVRDALAVLQFLINPHDNLNLMKLLRSPWCRISDQILVNSIRRGGESFWLQILNSELKSDVVILRLSQLLAQTRSSGLGRLWQDALIQLGFFDFSSHHDATGRREANLWKLTQSLSLSERKPGFNVIEFMLQSTSFSGDTESQDEGDAVTALQPNVVNLMTIHASKGLQRRHVIVPFCGKADRQNAKPLLAVDADSGIWSVGAQVMIDDLPETVQTPFAIDLQEQQRQRELEESDRLLYVALTRAEETVYLSWTGEPDSKSWANRWNWPIKSGVQEFDGYAVEYLSAQGESANQALYTESVQVPRSSWRQKNPLRLRQDVSSLKRCSVTALIEESRAEGAISSRGPQDVRVIKSKLDKALLGSDIHRLFEQMRYQPEQADQLIELLASDKRALIRRARDYVTNLQKPPMSELLRLGHAEWGFQLRTKHLRLEGQIDLWGEVDDQIWLIDYKTGSADHVNKALDQLDIYAFALRRFGFNKPMYKAVVYPLENKSVVEPVSSDDALIKRFPEISF